MAETNKLGNGTVGKGAAARDVVSLDDDAASSITEGAAGAAASQDSILNVAQVFEEQLEQMTAWKHQLAQQMELLRRDGIKLLEKQKNLALEKKRLGEERESITADRAYVQKLHGEVDEGNKRLTEKGEEIARGLAELQKLAGEKENWERELNAARAGAAAVKGQREKMAGELAAGEARLEELGRLTERHGELEQEIAAAEAAFAELRGEVAGLEKRREGMESRGAEVEARERGLAEREAKFAAAEAEWKAGLAEATRQREELTRAQDEMARERAELAERRREAEESVGEAARGVANDRAQLQEQVAEAKAALEGLGEARLRQEQRWTALEARAGELAAAEETLRGRETELAQQEQALRAGRTDVAAAQGQLAGQKSALSAAEREVAERMRAAEESNRLLEAEREGLAKQREELEEKLDLMEGELAEQYESLAKQTRRLTERRAEMDARTAGTERDTESRIERATAALQEELKRAEETYEQRVRALREQMEKTEADAAGWKKREEELQGRLASAEEAAAGLKTELAKVGKELNAESQGRIQQAEMLAEQVMRFEKETAAWQKKLEETVAEGERATADEQQLNAALDAAAGAKAEVERLTGQLAEVGAAREDLERRLGAETGRAKELQGQTEALAEKLAATERELAEWREKFKTADESAGESGAANAGDVEILAGKVKELERQRDELAAHLFATRDSQRRQADEALLTKNVMEGELLTLRAEKQALEQQVKENRRRGGEAGQGAAGEKVDVQAAEEALRHVQETTNWHRQRLLRQARTLRAYRKQMEETKSALAGNAAEISKQREQVRSRKENLEQVKRLLEKQEMVMARKLADHNALKTVAAVGIFVIMILGSVFAGVYKFVSPTYQSEAMVHLVPPANLKGAEQQAWLAKQAAVLKSNDVTYEAWKILRGAEEHYGMHDERQQWLASLQSSLVVQVDPKDETMFIRYKGSNAEGVTQVSNALATAYTTAGVVSGAAAAGTISAKAAVPQNPSEDNRFRISLSLVAGVLLASLVLVMMFRHYVARQLKEIDQMADEEDLADLKGEMA